MLHYWYLVWARSFWDSLHFVDKTGEGLLFDVLVLAASTSVIVWKNRSQKMTWQKLPRLILEGAGGVALFSWLLVFGVNLWWSPYKMQQETNELASVAETRRIQTVSENTLLKSDIGNRDGRIDKLNGKIDASAGQLSTTFTQLAQSQGVINSLGAQVAKISIPEPQKFATFAYAIDARKGSRIVQLLLATNKTVSPVSFMLECDADFSDYDYQVGRETETQLQGPNRRPTKRSAEIHVMSPPWTPMNPLLVTIYSDQPGLNECGLRPLK